MRKFYIAPEAEIERFTIDDILTASPTGGVNDGNTDIDFDDEGEGGNGSRAVYTEF